MTPEGKVKADIKAALLSHGAYYFMPVQMGYGAPGLDFHCVVQGQAFFIEAKAPGKKPTARQRLTMESMVEAGGRVFVVDGKESLEEVIKWMRSISTIE